MSGLLMFCALLDFEQCAFSSLFFLEHCFFASLLVFFLIPFLLLDSPFLILAAAPSHYPLLLFCKLLNLMIIASIRFMFVVSLFFLVSAAFSFLISIFLSDFFFFFILFISKRTILGIGIKTLGVRLLRVIRLLFFECISRIIITDFFFFFLL